MSVLAPKAKVDKELFPKLFQGEYGAEISTLLTSKSQALHSSFWDGDQESFIIQSGARGLAKRMPYVGTTAESAIWRLRDKMPDGTIVGARGPHGPLAPDSPLNTWFKTIYMDRYGTPPTYPSYQMALSILGLKVAWEKAQAAKGGGKPTTDEVVKAFKGIEYDSPSGPREDGARRRPPGHPGHRLRHLPLQQAEEYARSGRDRPLPGGVREPARRQDLRGMAQGRHAGGQVLIVS